MTIFSAKLRYWWWSHLLSMHKCSHKWRKTTAAIDKCLFQNRFMFIERVMAPEKQHIAVLYLSNFKRLCAFQLIFSSFAPDDGHSWRVLIKRICNSLDDVGIKLQTPFSSFPHSHLMVVNPKGSWSSVSAYPWWCRYQTSDAFQLLSSYTPDDGHSWGVLIKLICNCLDDLVQGLQRGKVERAWLV